VIAIVKYELKDKADRAVCVALGQAGEEGRPLGVVGGLMVGACLALERCVC